MKKWMERRKLENKEAYKKVRKGYHKKLEFTKNYWTM